MVVTRDSEGLHPIDGAAMVATNTGVLVGPIDKLATESERLVERAISTTAFVEAKISGVLGSAEQVEAVGTTSDGSRVERVFVAITKVTGELNRIKEQVERL